VAVKAASYCYKELQVECTRATAKTLIHQLQH